MATVPAAPGPSPAAGSSSRPVRVVEAPRADGPHVRAGLAAMVVASAALLAGPLWLAITMSVVGALGAAAVAARHRSLHGRPAAVAAAGGGLLPAASLAGPAGASAALTALVVASMLAGFERRAPSARRPGRAGAALLLGVGAGLAAAAPVLARDAGLGPALGLLALVAAHDAGAYVVGTGAHHEWEGPAAGMVSVAVLGFTLASFNIFGTEGVANVLLVGVVVLGAPLGPVVARALCPRRVPPVVGRLDVLLVAGPLFALAAAGLR